MPTYYINRNPQANGDHEVHESSCSWLALVTSKMELGYFANCHGAVAKAKQYYPTADGCKHCSPACHNS